MEMRWRGMGSRAPMVRRGGRGPMVTQRRMNLKVGVALFSNVHMLLELSRNALYITVKDGIFAGGGGTTFHCPAQSYRH